MHMNMNMNASNLLNKLSKGIASTVNANNVGNDNPHMNPSTTRSPAASLLNTMLHDESIPTLSDSDMEHISNLTHTHQCNTNSVNTNTSPTSSTHDINEMLTLMKDILRQYNHPTIIHSKHTIHKTLVLLHYLSIHGSQHVANVIWTMKSTTGILQSLCDDYNTALIQIHRQQSNPNQYHISSMLYKIKGGIVDVYDLWV